MFLIIITFSLTQTPRNKTMSTAHRTTLDFDHLWNHLQKFSNWLGILGARWTKVSHYLVHFILKFSTLLLIVQEVWTLTALQDGILTFLSCLCYGSMILFLSLTIIDSNRYKNDYQEILSWCKAQHGVQLLGLENFLCDKIDKTFDFAAKGAKLLINFSIFDALIGT